MEKMKPRKRIIDNTSVPLSRRTGKHIAGESVCNGSTRWVGHIGIADSTSHHDVIHVKQRDNVCDETYKDNNSGIVIKYRSNVDKSNELENVLNARNRLEIPALSPRFGNMYKSLNDSQNTDTYIDHDAVVADRECVTTEPQNQSKQNVLGYGINLSSINNNTNVANSTDINQTACPTLTNDMSHAIETKSEVKTATTRVLDSTLTNKAIAFESVKEELNDPLEYKPALYDAFNHQPSYFDSNIFKYVNKEDNGDSDHDGDEAHGDLRRMPAVYDAYSNMTDKTNGSPRLLSVEEKWQIIFNEKSRAPIYAVGQYIDYLRQFVGDKHVTPQQNDDVTRRDGINPVTYLLRKLKLDLKMSYDSFLDEFLKPENKGLELLIKLLKSIQNTGSQQSGSTNMAQLKNYKKTLTDEHDCLLCIKFSLRIKSALLKLLEIPYGLETVSMGLLSTFTKSRGTAIEILTVTLTESDGFARTLECFTFIRLKIGEPVRFKSLMNMMNMDSAQTIIFKVSTLKFLNSLIDCSPNYNHRVFLQHELECAGLDVAQIKAKVEDRTGLEFDDLRYELDQWERKYINVDDILKQNGLPSQHQQHLIDDLNIKVQVLSKENAFLERQLKAVSTELRTRYEELQRRIVSTRDVYVQCESTDKQTKNVGCQCTHYDDFGNPLKTAALYFGWQDTIDKDVMNYHDYQITIEGQGEEEESETDHVIKVEDWLRTHCESPDPDTDTANLSADENDDTRQHFRRQYSIRHKTKKTDFTGNWQFSSKPVKVTKFPSRLEGQQCHTTNCDRCHLANRQENSINKHKVVVQNVSRGLNKVILSSHNDNVQLESQSSDSAIGGSGDRLWNVKNGGPPNVSKAKSEEERLQDLITPDDSASACPEVEPFPDYSSVTTRPEKENSYEAELSEVLREFEGHLSRYETPPDFLSVSRSPEQVV